MPNKKGTRTAGQCWYPHASADGRTEVFISPAYSDSFDVARALAHELCHAANGKPCGHKGEFVVVDKALGFQKPWTMTPCGPDLEARLKALVEEIGPYPHATVDQLGKEASGGDKKKGTYLLKAECQGCGYTCRVTKKWVVEKGAPICPCNVQPMAVDLPDDDDGDGEEDLPEAA
jgi:hypothetical protein